MNNISHLNLASSFAQQLMDESVPYNRRGLIFAQRIERLVTLDETKKALTSLARQLKDRHNPPLRNDTDAGRELRDAWVRKHGRPCVIKKEKGSHSGHGHSD